LLAFLSEDNLEKSVTKATEKLRSLLIELGPLISKSSKAESTPRNAAISLAVVDLTKSP
jgi:hypothetical protein